jgi:NitT/TauT family transport system substrate-binding protein
VTALWQRLVGSTLAAALVAACGGSATTPSSPGAGGAPISVRVSYSEPVADDLPLWIGIEAGIFRQHGLSVSTAQVTSTQGISALLANEFDMALVGGSETLSADASGADLRVLVVDTPIYAYQFYANPSITSPSQLKGAKIATTRTGATLDIAAKVALRRMGLDPAKDVTFIQTGSVPNITAAMIGGQVQGTMSHPPDSLRLQRRGFHVLYDLAAQKVPFDAVGVTARASWINANKATVQRFVDAYVQAIHRELTDMAFSVKVLQKYLKMSDTSVLDQTYRFYATEIVQPLPYPTAAMFRDAQQVLGATNPRVKAFDVNTLLDPSFLQSAASRGLGR